MTLAQISEDALLQIDQIEKFYSAYQSALIFYGSQKITSQLPIGIQELVGQRRIPIVMRDKPPEPNEPNEIPDGLVFNETELKQYMLDFGQREIFANSLKLLYSTFEGFVRFRIESIEGTEIDIYVKPKTLTRAELSLESEHLVALYTLKETRNVYMHKNAIWDEKAAKNLSKNLLGNEDITHPLVFRTLSGDQQQFNVGETVNVSINQNAIFRYFTTNIKEIIQQASA